MQVREEHANSPQKRNRPFGGFDSTIMTPQTHYLGTVLRYLYPTWEFLIFIIFTFTPLQFKGKYSTFTKKYFILNYFLYFIFIWQL